jgi:uncharacterized membrane protein
MLLAALAAPPAAFASPTVNVVFFYSPTCPHCHRVMTEVLPPIQGRFGDGLRLLFLDVSGPQGGAMFQAAITRFRIPVEKQGVPTLIAGDVVLTGDQEIPARLPGLVERLMATGGAPAPDFVLAPLAGLDTGPAPAPAASAFPRLPAGKASVAILGALLLGLLVQLAHAAFTWRRRPAARSRKPGAARRWAILALALASLGVALYLAHAEIRGGHVVCLSDCDAVHASEWAWLLGLVPVGAFGAFGALGIVAAWLLAAHRDARVAARADAALLAMALFGVAFSAYLTFLELFVIGAMCEWCVGNAVMMGLIAGLQLAPGKRALDLALRRGPAATLASGS